MALTANAQIDASSPDGRPQPKEELPKSFKESLIKQRIEREKKEYEELLARGEEAVKLSEELEKSFEQKQQLNLQDKEKLERLEKLLKKIRKDLGGEDDKDEDDSAETSSMFNAFKTLQETTVQLFDELKKQTRHTVSAIAIQSSNTLLRLVKFLRFAKN